MRVATAILVFSFFLPALCEIATAASTPAHSCPQHQSQREAPADSKGKYACCLLATLQRPVLKERAYTDGLMLIAPAIAPAILVSSLESHAKEFVVTHQERIDQSPPRLWVLSAAFLI